MPKTNRTCIHCNKTFKRKDAFERHIGNNKSSGLPNCKVHRELILKKKEIDKELKLKDNIVNYNLINGTEEQQINILKSKWIEYLFNEYGKNSNTYSAFLKLKKQITKAMKTDIKYWRYYKTTEHKEIDYKNQHEMPDIKGVSGRTGDSKYFNPNYLGKENVEKILYKKMFEIIFGEWNKTLQIITEGIKGGKNYLYKVCSFEDIEGQYWNFKNVEPKLCIECDCELDYRDDWVCNFEKRHPEEFKKVKDEDMCIFNPICSKCLSEEDVEYYERYKNYTKYVWKEELNTNTNKETVDELSLKKETIKLERYREEYAISLEVERERDAEKRKLENRVRKYFFEDVPSMFKGRIKSNWKMKKQSSTNI